MVLQVRWCTQSWSMSRLNVTEYTSTFFLSNSVTSSSPFLFLVCYLIYTYIINFLLYTAAATFCRLLKNHSMVVFLLRIRYIGNILSMNLYIYINRTTFKPWVEDIWFVFSYCNCYTQFLCDIVLQHFWYDPKWNPCGWILTNIKCSWI